MSGRFTRHGFALRRSDIGRSNKAAEGCLGCAHDATLFAARLTNDVAPLLHGRIELGAVDTQREPRLAPAFPNASGESL